MFKRFVVLLAALSLLALLAPAGANASESDHGRSESDHHESESDGDDDDESDGDDHIRTYEVTITNLTEGQPFTPPLVAVTDKRVRLFRVGRAASPEIREIAENGNLAPMLALLDPASNRHVSSLGAIGGPVVPAGLPCSVSFGDSVTLTVTGDEDAKYLSWASMLICTNDGFTGVDRMRLPKRVGHSISVRTAGYDAGTEINTEDFADIVPPCQGLVGISSDDTGTGMSNPALAQNGRIRPHRGIEGGNDLQPLHNFHGPVATISIVRVD